MAVIIKDMKMPESCDDCLFNWCDIHTGISYCEIKNLDTTDLFLLRHEDCPLTDADR